MRVVAQKLGGTTETVRQWVRRAEVVAEARLGVISEVRRAALAAGLGAGVAASE